MLVCATQKDIEQMAKSISLLKPMLETRFAPAFPVLPASTSVRLTWAVLGLGPGLPVLLEPFVQVLYEGVLCLGVILLLDGGLRQNK